MRTIPPQAWRTQPLRHICRVEPIRQPSGECGNPASLHGMGLIPVKPPTPSAVKENGTLVDSMVRGKAMTKHAGQMDARIAAAFTDSATSDDVGGLLAEVEAAVNPPRRHRRLVLH